MLNNKLREVRTDVGMSIAELARRAHTSRQTIYLIEKGEIKNISGNLMFAIADALKRDERDIFFTHRVNHVQQNQTA
jgi:putative transcriptional regulator